MVRQLQLLRRPFEAEGAQLVPEHFVRGFEDAASFFVRFVHVPAHAGVLRSLSGKDESEPGHDATPPHRRRAPPHVKPAPKPIMRTLAPSRRSPCDFASSRATGTLAA